VPAPTKMTVPVSDIVAGDVFAGPGGWTALENAEVEDTGDVTLFVRFTADQGTSWRRWDDPSITLAIVRG
jgi:hypothetical protein